MTMADRLCVCARVLSAVSVVESAGSCREGAGSIPATRNVVLGKQQLITTSFMWKFNPHKGTLHLRHNFQNSMAFDKAPQRETTNCWPEASLGVGRGGVSRLSRGPWPRLHGPSGHYMGPRGA